MRDQRREGLTGCGGLARGMNGMAEERSLASWDKGDEEKARRPDGRRTDIIPGEMDMVSAVARQSPCR